MIEDDRLAVPVTRRPVRLGTRGVGIWQRDITLRIRERVVSVFPTSEAEAGEGHLIERDVVVRRESKREVEYSGPILRRRADRRLLLHDRLGGNHPIFSE